MLSDQEKQEIRANKDAAIATLTSPGHFFENISEEDGALLGQLIELQAVEVVQEMYERGKFDVLKPDLSTLQVKTVIVPS